MEISTKKFQQRLEEAAAKRGITDDEPVKPEDMTSRIIRLEQSVKQLSTALQESTQRLADMIKQLHDDRFPKFVGTKEACSILGIGRTKLLERINEGDLPFAFKDQTGHWRFGINDLYRSIGQ